MDAVAHVDHGFATRGSAERSSARGARGSR